MGRKKGKSIKLEKDKAKRMHVSFLAHDIVLLAHLIKKRGLVIPGCEDRLITSDGKINEAAVKKGGVSYTIRCALADSAESKCTELEVMNNIDNLMGMNARTLEKLALEKQHLRDIRAEKLKEKNKVTENIFSAEPVGGY